jgi:hypothetical protein
VSKCVVGGTDGGRGENGRREEGVVVVLKMPVSVCTRQAEEAVKQGKQNQSKVTGRRERSRMPRSLNFSSPFGHSLGGRRPVSLQWQRERRRRRKERREQHRASYEQEEERKSTTEFRCRLSVKEERKKRVRREGRGKGGGCTDGEAERGGKSRREEEDI